MSEDSFESRKKAHRRILWTLRNKHSPGRHIVPSGGFVVFAGVTHAVKTNVCNTQKRVHFLNKSI